MEPVVAEFLAAAMGVVMLPGQQGWIGNAHVMGGALAVMAPSRAKSLGH